MNKYMVDSTDRRGTMVRHGSVWRINNALVEEVSANGRTGYLIVSYAEPGSYGMTHIELLRLNVGIHTVITNEFGRSICLCDIRPGMWIDAAFSPAMTRSIPPQTTAYRIVVRQRGHNISPPRRPTMTAQVAGVDTQNGFLITGDPSDINEQTRFVVTADTVILDSDGRRISLRSLRPGQWVRVTHADFMTLSIPPQTTAYRIQVL
jgi:hypothetical protein